MIPDVFGNSLHLLVDDAATATAAVSASLAQHGINGARLHGINPSMEDMFVHLVRADRAAAT